MTAPTLVEFLAARFAEDVAVAELVSNWDAHVASEMDGFSANARRFATLVTPTRVLAEVESKRVIVSRCDLVIRGRDVGMFSNGEQGFAVDSLRALAMPYADHPDFRDEWRP